MIGDCWIDFVCLSYYFVTIATANTITRIDIILTSDGLNSTCRLCLLIIFKDGGPK